MRIEIVAAGVAFGLTLICGFSVVNAQDGDIGPDEEFMPLVRTVDQRAAGRCIGDLVGFSNVRLQCVVDERGTPAQCILVNPTPAVQRHESVFQCVASKMKVSYSDGSPAVGRSFVVWLGGKTAISNDEYQRLRDEERRNP